MNNETEIRSDLSESTKQEGQPDAEKKPDRAQRSRLLYGADGLQKLKDATVLVAGVGGVGSFAVEALARSGVGRLILIDKDVVEPSNINRQLCATLSSVGKVKVDILKERIADLNPDCEVLNWHCFYDENLNDQIAQQKPDFILDCIDSIGSKKDLIRFALDHDIPVISSMGMARKKDPSLLQITEVEKTSYDPIAKILRSWKRKNRIRKKIMVVSSTEKPVDMEQGEPLPSGIFVPSSAGLLMASWAARQIMEGSEKKPSSKEKKPQTGAETEQNI